MHTFAFASLNKSPLLRLKARAFSPLTKLKVIRDCPAQGLRCVHIITGKGLDSPGRIPALKHKVYGWLLQKQDVLAFVQARAAEGGPVP